MWLIPIQCLAADVEEFFLHRRDGEFEVIIDLRTRSFTADALERRCEYRCERSGPSPYLASYSSSFFLLYLQRRRLPHSCVCFRDLFHLWKAGMNMNVFVVKYQQPNYWPRDRRWIGEIRRSFLYFPTKKRGYFGKVERNFGAPTRLSVNYPLPVRFTGVRP